MKSLVSFHRQLWSNGWQAAGCVRVQSSESCHATSSSLNVPFEDSAQQKCPSQGLTCNSCFKQMKKNCRNAKRSFTAVSAGPRRKFSFRSYRHTRDYLPIADQIKSNWPEWDEKSTSASMTSHDKLVSSQLGIFTARTPKNKKNYIHIVSLGVKKMQWQSWGGPLDNSAATTFFTSMSPMTRLRRKKRKSERRRQKTCREGGGGRPKYEIAHCVPIRTNEQIASSFRVVADVVDVASCNTSFFVNPCSLQVSSSGSGKVEEGSETWSEACRKCKFGGITSWAWVKWERRSCCEQNDGFAANRCKDSSSRVTHVDGSGAGFFQLPPL